MQAASPYARTTRSITVTVEPFYLEDQSSPDDHHYVWAYHVQIENLGSETVQVLGRYWRITDSRGNVQEVEGEGVVGEQPVLAPGDVFEYTSGTPLSTPSGIMGGYYRMKTETGVWIDVGIPTFSLDSPHESIQIN